MKLLYQIRSWSSLFLLIFVTLMFLFVVGFKIIFLKPIEALISFIVIILFIRFLFYYPIKLILEDLKFKINKNKKNKKIKGWLVIIFLILLILGLIMDYQELFNFNGIIGIILFFVISFLEIYLLGYYPIKLILKDIKK